MKIPIIKLQLTMDKSVEYLRVDLSSTGKAAGWMGKLIGNSNREQVAVVCCDSGFQATHVDIVSIGAVDCSYFNISEIFKLAVMTNASGIMMFHNHPSGRVVPSQADIEVTEKIVGAGKLLGIKLIDHIIIGSTGKYYSLRENRVIQ